MRLRAIAGCWGVKKKTEIIGSEVCFMYTGSSYQLGLKRFSPAQDDHLETSSTSTCCSLHYFQSCKEFIDAARAHVGESCSMPSSAVGNVGNDKRSSFLLSVSLLPWLGPLVYQDGVTAPAMNPGRPLREKERAPEHHL